MVWPIRYRGTIRPPAKVLTVNGMRKIVAVVGVVLLLMGVSGTIDHLAVQPIFGFLNVLNRFVFPRLVPDHVLYANLVVALLGYVLVVAAERAER